VSGAWWTQVDDGYLSTCDAWGTAERSSLSAERPSCTANDDERDERRLADGLHDVTCTPSVAMAAAAAAAAAMAALLCSELLRAPRWNALRRSVDATMPAIVSCDRQTDTQTHRPRPHNTTPAACVID